MARRFAGVTGGDSRRARPQNATGSGWEEELGNYGGMLAAMNGTAGAWKGDRATITAARSAQTACGRYTITAQ
jgi:hypothetical protein